MGLRLHLEVESKQVQVVGMQQHFPYVRFRGLSSPTLLQCLGGLQLCNKEKTL